MGWYSVSALFCGSNYKPFSTLNTPLSWLIYLYSVMKTFFFLATSTSLSRGSLLHPLKTLQYLEKSPDCRSLSFTSKLFFFQQLSILIFLLCMNARLLSVWYFCSHLKHECCCCTHLLQKEKKTNYVTFVIIEVYIFIQRFGLYCGLVTDCTFVEKWLCESSQQSPNNHSCSSELRAVLRIFPDSPGSQCVRLSSFQPGW